jgi:hypothetical protein
MASQIVPLTTNPNQTFQISLAINGGVTRLTLSIYYNEMANYWCMDITDVNGNPLLASVPLITGVWPAANLLEQYQYLNIGSAYILSLGDPNDYPNANSLGLTFLLLWSDNV